MVHTTSDRNNFMILCPKEAMYLQYTINGIRYTYNEGKDFLPVFTKSEDEIHKAINDYLLDNIELRLDETVAALPCGEN